MVLVDRSVLRILDANFNRVREALRVMEEHARMILDDAALARRIKECRHRLAAAMTAFDIKDLLASRDALGDVGTAITTESESTRDGTLAVALAAAKRAGESLRVIEEYSKTLNSAVAQQVESIRYEVYSLEQELLLGGPRRRRLRDARLHVLVTADLCRGDWLRVTAAALAGGADIIQLREKDLPDRELLDRAIKLRRLTQQHDALLIINDRPDIALLANADGVHLGLDDLPVAEARRIVGPLRLIGATAHSPDEARAALAEKPDYLGLGPMFASPTKPKIAVNGPRLLREVIAAASMDAGSPPLVAIGGITTDNITQLTEAFAIPNAPPIAIAICQAVIAAEDSEVAARHLKSCMKKMQSSQKEP